MAERDWIFEITDQVLVDANDVDFKDARGGGQQARIGHSAKADEVISGKSGTEIHS